MTDVKHTPKLTPWFPQGSKPVRKGVYIASVGHNAFYRYWNGKWWCNGSFALEDVQRNVGGGKRAKYGSDKNQAEIRWRGLAEDPSAHQGTGFLPPNLERAVNQCSESRGKK